MADNDGITGDIRSREEEYFRRKDRELVERLRRTAEADEARRALEATSGIHDPAALQELAALGFTPDTVSLLPMVPIIQMAWAEGGVSDEERALILQFARERGIRAGSVADQQLSLWLRERPGRGRVRESHPADSGVARSPRWTGTDAPAGGSDSPMRRDRGGVRWHSRIREDFRRRSARCSAASRPR